MPNGSDSLFVLSAGIDGSPLVPAGSVEDRGGTPVRRFTKFLPATLDVKTAKGQRLSMTPERWDTWIGNFERMRANRVNVPIVTDHKDGDSGGGLGEVVGMFRDGDRVGIVHEFRGQEAIELAGRVPWISPAINLDFRDGPDTSYGEVIEHSSITLKPVVPQDTEWIDTKRIAASRVAVLSRANRSDSDTMKDFDRIRKAMGLGEDVTPDNFADHVDSFVNKSRESAESLQSRLDEAVANQSKADQTISELRAQVGGDDGPGQDVLDDRADIVSERINSRVEAGKLTEAQGAALSRILCGVAGGRATYMLSRSADGKPYRAMDVLGWVDEFVANPPPAVGEKTGPQGVELSRVSDESEDKEIKAMLSRALKDDGDGDFVI